MIRHIDSVIALLSGIAAGSMHGAECFMDGSKSVRKESPEGQFHLILCRNVAFTYFDLELQTTVLGRLVESLSAAGVLVIGKHESLPSLHPQLSALQLRLGSTRR